MKKSKALKIIRTFKYLIFHHFSVEFLLERVLFQHISYYLDKDNFCLMSLIILSIEQIES